MLGLQKDSHCQSQASMLSIQHKLTVQLWFLNFLLFQASSNFTGSAMGMLHSAWVCWCPGVLRHQRTWLWHQWRQPVQLCGVCQWGLLALQGPCFTWCDFLNSGKLRHTSTSQCKCNEFYCHRHSTLWKKKKGSYPISNLLTN